MIAAAIPCATMALSNCFLEPKKENKLCFVMIDKIKK